MLNERVFKVGGKVFSILSYFGAIPYRWDPESCVLKRCVQCRKKCNIFTLSFILYICYLVEEEIRFYYSDDLSNFNFCYLFIITNLLLLICLSVQHWPNDAGIVSFNSVLSYTRTIGKFQITYN